MIGSILGLLDFENLRGIAHGLSRALVGLQVKWQSVLAGDAGENGEPAVGHREADLSGTAAAFSFTSTMILERTTAFEALRSL